VTRAQSGFGRYAASEADVILTPNAGMSFDNLAHPTKRAVLFAHGAGGTAYHAIWANEINQVGGPKICKTIAEAGWPVVAGDLAGPAAWGNTTFRSRVSDLKTFAQNKGARSGTVHIVGVSMGGLVLNWVRANLSLVASVILILPAINPEYVRANNIGNNAAAINTAYGGSYVDATERATSNPSYYAGTGDLDSVPIQCWHVTDDIYTPNSMYTQFDSDANLAEMRSLGALGHTDEAIATIVWGDMLTFLAAHD
jgi:pimeloyl-ACP methyl ester carboxylesterase